MIEQLVLQLGFVQADSQICVKLDQMLSALRRRFHCEVSDISDMKDLSKLANPVATTTQVVLLVFNESPANMPTDGLNRLYNMLIDESSNRRKRLVHVVKNFKAIDSEATWQMSKRAKRMFIFHDLETTPLEQLAIDIQKSIDTDSFSSPGESFAWQLVVGFLCYILPNFQACIRSTLLDNQHSLRAEILQDFGVTDVDPKQVLVLPKYFLLLSEQIVSNEVSVAMTPQELFPGCVKISRDSSDLCLEFDSPGYKKRIASYLMKLEKPLTSAESTFSHVIIFCGYAAPMFVMQKLDMSNDEKKLMFGQFRDELQLILSHPKSGQMLCEFSDARAEEITGLESSAVQLIDAEVPSSLEAAIIQDAETHLLTQSWCLLPKSLPQPTTDEASMEDLPLMSMAFAMAANSWIGFSQILLNYIRNLTSEGQQLPFDPPYCFVIPRSGRYPDEAKLHKHFEEIGVKSEQQQFQAPNGRRYTFRVHAWNLRRISFEIPASVLGIRRQAECGVGGVRTADLSAHLAEFRDILAGFVSASDGSFRVIEWDDVTEFHDDAWMEPSPDFALSLLRCLESALN